MKRGPEAISDDLRQRLTEDENLGATFDGATPLHLAIEHGQDEVAIALINTSKRTGTDIEALYKDKTPLVAAILHGRINIIEALLKAGANKEVLYNDNTPLHLAFSHDSKEAVKALIKHGVNIEALYNGKTPLLRAYERDLDDITIDLIKKGANTEALFQEQTLLNRAIGDGKTYIAIELINHGANLETLYKEKTPLHRAIMYGLSDIVIKLLEKGANKEALFLGKTPLHRAISLYSFVGIEITKQLIRFGCCKKLPLEALKTISSSLSFSASVPDINSSTYKDSETLFNELFPHATIAGITLQSIFNNNLEHFNDINEKRALVYADDAIGLLLEKNYPLSKVTREALKILHIKKNINTQIAQQQHEMHGDEGASSDKAVLRARRHFENTVRPHFLSTFLRCEQNKEVDISDDEKLKRIEAIEKSIREFLLEQIQQESKDEKAVTEFIEKNRAALIEGENEAMKSSVDVFNLPLATHAAWRGYNPHAPVCVSTTWVNLLTPSHNEKNVYTMAAASDHSAVTQKQASLIVREWGAYYFLILQDIIKTQDRAIQETAITHYITQLADIRNAHGLDDPSCFPGHLTRFAMAGAYHPDAKLPSSLQVDLAWYFRGKILAQFKTQLANLSTIEAKQNLLHALIDLTETTAESIIVNNSRYSEEWLALREEFRKSLGLPKAILFDVREKVFPFLVDEDIIFIEQNLLDLARGDIGGVLAECLNNELDSKPTPEDIIFANKFAKDTKEYKLFQALFSTIVARISCYTKSLNKLNTLSDYLAQKVSVLLENPDDPLLILSDILSGLDVSAEQSSVLMDDLFKNLSDFHIIPQSKKQFQNPFTEELRFARKLPDTAHFIKRVAALEKKHAMFNQCAPIIASNFEGVAINDTMLSQLAPEIAMQLQSSPELTLTVESLLQNMPTFVAHKERLQRIISAINDKMEMNEHLSTTQQMPQSTPSNDTPMPTLTFQFTAANKSAKRKEPPVTEKNEDEMEVANDNAPMTEIDEDSLPKTKYAKHEKYCWIL